MKKKAPTFKSDKEIKEFLDHELTDYIDLQKIQPVPFEFLPKTEIVNLSFPPERLTAVRGKNRKRGDI